MNLVPSNANQTMSSREIAELLNTRHDVVKRTIERLSTPKYEDDLKTVKKPAVIDEPPLVEYLDSLDRPAKEYKVGKRESYIIVAQLSPEFTAKLVDRWQELETQQAPKVPQTMAEALRLAADQAELIEQQQQQLTLAAPKVQFVDKFVDRTALQNATQVGQVFGLSAVKLNRALDEIGNVYNKSCKRGRAFVQSWVDDGYGEMKQTEVGHPQALFTTKGIQRVTELLTSEGVI
jgi:phage regulator Rha-like protein